MTPAGLASGLIVETSLGWIGVIRSARGLVRSTLLHRSEAAASAELRAWGAMPGASPFEDAQGVADRLTRYAAGEAEALRDYPVDLSGATQLQERTWLALRTIPAGETRSYGWLAEAVEAPGQARAIGAMVGANPLPLWLPCHRVVAADGTLHGFAGGLAMKQALLQHEGALPARLI